MLPSGERCCPCSVGRSEVTHLPEVTRRVTECGSAPLPPFLTIALKESL